MTILTQARFNIANGIVRKIADQTAGETRQPLYIRCLEAMLIFTDYLQRVFTGEGIYNCTIFYNFYQIAGCAENLTCRQAVDRITTGLLATGNRLKQIGVLTTSKLDIGT